MSGEIRARSWQTLKPDGILVSVLGPPPSAEDAARHGVRQTMMWVQANPAQLAEIAGLADAGQLKVHLEAVFPLEEAAKAHELSATGQARGKIVLRVAGYSEGAR